MTIAPFPRTRKGRVFGGGVAAVLAAMGWLGEVAAVEGVEGDGFHSGTSRHDVPFEHASGDPPCAHEHKIEYEGVGTADVGQGRIRYFGPVTVKYLLEDVWAAPAGTIFPPQSNHVPATACYFHDGNGNFVRDANGDPVPALGAVPVKSASVAGDATDGSRLRCLWDQSSGGTYRRGSSEEELTLPPGASYPVEGTPGTCTITPSVGRPRVSNTGLVSAGTFQACAGLPPAACQHVNSMELTTAGPVPPEPPPVVASIQAGSGVQGAGQSVSIKGEEFASDAMPSFSGSGISVDGVGGRSSTAMMANITVAPDAAVGPRDVVVTNGDGTTGMCPGCFTVLGAGGTPAVPPGSNPPAALLAAPASGGANPPDGPPTGGSEGASQSLTGPSFQNTFIPAPTASSPGGPGLPASPGGPPPSPPGGTGLAPVTAPGQAPAAIVALEAQQEAESAPQAGTKIMMVGLGEPYMGLLPALALGGLAILGFAAIRPLNGHSCRATPVALSPAPSPATVL